MKFSEYCEITQTYGADNSQSVIGVEMASAYVGIIAMPPLFGVIAQHVSIGLLPLYIGVLTVIMFVCLEILNAQLRKRQNGGFNSAC